jgi:hypothetical protein
MEMVRVSDGESRIRAVSAYPGRAFESEHFPARASVS